MKRIPAVSVVRHFSEICDQVLSEPIVVTRNGRDRLAMINVVQLRHILALAVLAAGEPKCAEQIGEMLKEIA